LLQKAQMNSERILIAEVVIDLIYTFFLKCINISKKLFYWLKWSITLFWSKDWK